MSTWFRATALCGAVAVAFGFTPQVFALGEAPQAHVALTRGVQAPEVGVESADGRYSASGVPISLFCPQFTAQVAAPEAMAREYLASRRVQLGLATVDRATLVRTSLREGRDFSVVRFRQMHEGLPVYGSDVAVSVKPNGEIIHVANSTVAGLAPIVNTQSKTALDAVEIARHYLGVARLTHDKAERMAYVATDGTRAVWRVEAVSDEAASRGDWELLVDAQSGEVLRAQNRAMNVDGTGTIWTPDPLSYKKVAYGAAGYVDGDNADTPELTAALVSVTLPGITQNGANYELSGQYAVCDDWAVPHDAGCPSQASTDFSVTRSGVTFDAVMAYYHISTYLQYVNVTLGIAAMPLRQAGGVHFDPHGEGGDDNSAYYPSLEKLSFGEGGVDDAQDADVLTHELGHGIHDWITSGNGSQTEGLSEGFGDYVAGAYSRDFPNQWTPADTAYNWVYSWDGHNPFWPGRVLNYQRTRTYAQVRNQEIHLAGQYWSSCNLEARKNIQAIDPAAGGKIFDKAYFKGLSMTGADTNQKDAAQAVIDAAAALGYPQAQIDAIGVAYNSGNQNGNTGCTYAVTVPTASNAPVVHVDVTPLAATAEVGASVGTSLAVGNTGSVDLTWNVDTSDDAACTTPSTVSWLTVAPTSGTVVARSADAIVAITLDAAALTAGDYATHLCVHSNDPQAPVVAVPVAFTVKPAAVTSCSAQDKIFCDGFDAAATLAQPIQDPGFEATGENNANPYWVGTSDSNLGADAPLFVMAGATPLGAAHSGDFVVRVGGWGTTSVTRWRQSVTIPAGGPRWLNFWRKILRAPHGEGLHAALSVQVDGTLFWQLDMAAIASDEDWVETSIDVSRYADGAAHEFEFIYGAIGTNFVEIDDGDVYFDDITIDVTQGSSTVR